MTVPTVVATSDSQSVVDTVSYHGGTPVNADAFQVTSVSTQPSTLSVNSTRKSDTSPITIDGVLDHSEWVNPAITKTLIYTNIITGENDTHEMTGYFMNDDNYLYIAAKVTNVKFKSADVDVFEIYFDNNNDGVIEPGESIKSFWNLQYDDWEYEGNGGWGSVSVTEGQGVASQSNHSGIGDYTYEFMIPLKSNDVQKNIGSVVGIKTLFREMYYDEASDNWKWGSIEDGWPSKEGRFDGSTYGKLYLAGRST